MDAPQIIFTFDRESNTHSLETKGVNGREMLLALQSLMENIEEESGMGIGQAFLVAKAIQDKEEKAEEK